MIMLSTNRGIFTSCFPVCMPFKINTGHIPPAQGAAVLCCFRPSSVLWRGVVRVTFALPPMSEERCHCLTSHVLFAVGFSQMAYVRVGSYLFQISWACLSSVCCWACTAHLAIPRRQGQKHVLDEPHMTENAGKSRMPVFEENKWSGSSWMLTAFVCSKVLWTVSITDAQKVHLYPPPTFLWIIVK